MDEELTRNAPYMAGCDSRRQVPRGHFPAPAQGGALENAPAVFGTGSPGGREATTGSRGLLRRRSYHARQRPHAAGPELPAYIGTRSGTDL